MYLFIYLFKLANIRKKVLLLNVFFFSTRNVECLHLIVKGFTYILCNSLISITVVKIDIFFL